MKIDTFDTKIDWTSIARSWTAEVLAFRKSAYDKYEEALIRLEKADKAYISATKLFDDACREILFDLTGKEKDLGSNAATRQANLEKMEENKFKIMQEAQEVRREAKALADIAKARVDQSDGEVRLIYSINMREAK